jgi:hypothetical protein
MNSQIGAESLPRVPYVGLRAFEQQEGRLFFGRERESSEIFSLLVAHRELLLYAPSGAGKSSLIHAGLIPRLEAEGFEVLRVRRVGGLIPAGIRAAEIENIFIFNSLISWTEDEVSVQQIAQTSLVDFLKAREHSLDEYGFPAARTLIFDQFEELFTFGHERRRDRESFFNQVRAALEDDPLLRVMFAIREDFIAQLDPYVPILPEKLRTRYRLESMRREAALAAIKKPMEYAGRAFAEGVAEELVEELLAIKVLNRAGEIVVVAGEFVEPVQLQVACESLWKSLPVNKLLITLEDLGAFGDVDLALATFYEQAVKGAARQAQIGEGKLRAWFENSLITPAGTRGTVYRGQTTTGGIPNTVIDALEEVHIIRGEWRAGARWYELVHDRIVNPIQLSNREWREAGGAGLLRSAAAAVARALRRSRR